MYAGGKIKWKVTFFSLRDDSWFVKWVRIKIATGEHFHCDVSGWIDNWFVVSTLISLKTHDQALIKMYIIQ